MPGSPAKPRGIYCTISGQVPDSPVVSIRSGHLFERRLIEAALSANDGLCPETGEPLSTSDLLPVRSSTVIPPLEHPASVPDALRYLQKEWDGITLELHEARSVLHDNRKELASALYRCEAAERVVARLNKENEELKRAARLGTATGQVESDSTKEQENRMSSMLLPHGMLQRGRELSKELQTGRKHRTLPVEHASAGIVGAFGEVARVKVDGIVTGLAVGPEGTIAGCTSGLTYHVRDNNVGPGIKVCDGAVRRVRMGQEGLYAVCGGGRVGMWQIDGQEKWGSVMDGAADVDLWSLDGVVVAAAEGGEWQWRDFGQGGTVVGRGAAEKGLRALALHPDGMVFATGGKQGVQMWDVGSMECVARLDSGAGVVRDIVMSEKGYYMGVVRGAEVQVWDLRKRDVSGVVAVVGALGLGFDGAGEFGCAVGAEGITVFGAKKKARVLARLPGGVGGGIGEVWRVGCGWEDDARGIQVGGEDSVVRLSSK